MAWRVTTFLSAWVAAGGPQGIGGPTSGYRLMLKRQREGAAMTAPAMLEARIEMHARVLPDHLAETWD